MYSSDNLIPYSLSCLTLNRFAAVGSQYSIVSNVDLATCPSCKTSSSQIVCCWHLVFAGLIFHTLSKMFYMFLPVVSSMFFDIVLLVYIPTYCVFCVYAASASLIPKLLLLSTLFNWPTVLELMQVKLQFLKTQLSRIIRVWLHITWQLPNQHQQTERLRNIQHD